MSADVLYAKILSRFIWDKYEEVVTFKDILSLESPVSDEHLVMIQDSKDWMIGLSKHFTIYDKSLTPAGIFATCKQWLKKFGDFVDIAEHKEIYQAYNDDAYKVIAFDHVGLISGEGSKKQRIDRVVQYMIHFKNKCDTTTIFVQQLNRTAKSMDRKLNGYELIQLDDKGKHKEFK